MSFNVCIFCYYYLIEVCYFNMLVLFVTMCVGTYRSLVCLVCVVFVPIVLHSPLGMWVRSVIELLIIFIQSSDKVPLSRGLFVQCDALSPIRTLLFLLVHSQYAYINHIV